jgi:cell division protein FtsW
VKAEGRGERSTVPEERAGRRSDSGRRRSQRHVPAAQPGPGVAARRALILVTFLLLLYGLVMAYSASSAQAYFEYGSSFHLVERQVAFVVIGIAAMGLLSRVDYAWYRRLAVPLSGVVLFALAVVLIPGIGTSANGARRWLTLGGQGIQPSEFAKLAAVMLVATLIVRRPAEITRPSGFLRLGIIGIVPSAVLIMLEPDLGTTLVLILAVVAVLIAGGARLRQLLMLVAAGGLAVLALIVVEPYRLQRLTTFFDPWQDPQGSGFQATQSLISIASGRIFGVGLGNSVQKFGFLPEQGTDMITGIIGEELGLIGLIVLIALYVALTWACFRIALDCKELFGKLLATGITAIVVGQACINVGAALGLLPLTGVPLPLVSLGGTSLVVVLGGLGILLNIATNRRSFIVVSTQRSDRASRGRGHGRAPAAGARRRG